jgi:hypothetical protein
MIIARLLPIWTIRGVPHAIHDSLGATLGLDATMSNFLTIIFARGNDDADEAILEDFGSNPCTSMRELVILTHFPPAIIVRRRTKS